MSISAVQGVETLVIENNVLEVHSMYKKKANHFNYVLYGKLRRLWNLGFCRGGGGMVAIIAGDWYSG